jgi:hypothetical protein
MRPLTMCPCQSLFTRHKLDVVRERDVLQASGSLRSAGLVDANDLADVFVLVLGGINRLRNVICDLRNSLVTPQCASAPPPNDEPPHLHWTEHSDGKAPACTAESPQTPETIMPSPLLVAFEAHAAS